MREICGGAAVAFYGNADCFSNFFPTRFEHRGRAFRTSEQCFMYLKALLFGDAVAAEDIAAAATPLAAKRIGRKVRNFDQALWDARKSELMVEANLAKFSSSPDIASRLLATGDRKIVEASPTDRIWGVGLPENDPRIDDPKNWRGQNLLGEALVEVRAMIR